MLKRLRDAVLALREQYMQMPPVIGVGAQRDPQTGEYQIVIYVYPLQGETPGPESVKTPDRYQGFPVVVRQPRWEVPDEKEDEEDHERPGRHRHGDNSDFRFLDWGKIHQIHMAELRQKPVPAAPPRVRIDGEIIAIEDDGTLVTSTGALDYARAWEIFRTYFGDDYDFVSFYIDRNSTDASGNKLPGPGGAVGITIYNDIRGINHYRGDHYDNRAAWQGSTKLLAYQAYSGANWSLGVQLQEVGHYWGAFVYHRDPVSDPTERDELHREFSVPGQEIFHWGTWFDNDNSSMDYDSQDWVSAGSGRWTRSPVTDANAGYHRLDLYLMGLLAKSEVGTITYINNPVYNAGIGAFTGSAVNLTINNITANHGDRDPAYPNTQRVFHLAHVVLTKDLDAVGDLTTGFIQRVEQNRRALTERFRRATNGRAMLDTSLLHGNFRSLYVRDNAADTGAGSSTGAFWNSPDIWIRNHDDGGLHHQNTIRGQDNFIHVRVHNGSGAAYEDVTVRVYLANFAGTQFRYPDDWHPDRLIGEATLPSVPARGSAIAKIRWPASAIPGGAAAMHPCLLAEVIPMETEPAGRHHVWENRKLAQKNITIVDAPRGTVTRLPQPLRLAWPVVVGNKANGPTVASLALHAAVLHREMAQMAADGVLARETTGRLSTNVDAGGLPEGVSIYIDPQGALPEAFEELAAQNAGQQTLFISSGTEIGVGCGPCAEEADYVLTFCGPAKINVNACRSARQSGAFKGIQPVRVGGRRLLKVTDAREAALTLPLAEGEEKQLLVEVHVDGGQMADRSLLLSLVQGDETGAIAGGVDLLVNG